MIVYVESNFVLELVFRQEQFDAASRLLSMAEGQSIELVIPAFALVEPDWTISKRRVDNERALGGLTSVLNQVQRSPHLEMYALGIIELLEALEELHVDHLRTYRTLLERLLRGVRVLDLSVQHLAPAMELETRYGLGRFDSIILAQVLHDLSEQPEAESKLFASRDRRGFQNKEIQQHLKAFGCAYIPSFGDAIALIESSTR
jgi:predicted nucleic acid-binding protein